MKTFGFTWEKNWNKLLYINQNYSCPHQITSEVTGYFGARCKTRACFFKCDKNAIQFVLCWTTGTQFVEDNKFLAKQLLRKGKDCNAPQKRASHLQFVYTLQTKTLPFSNNPCINSKLFYSKFSQNKASFMLYIFCSFNIANNIKHCWKWQCFGLESIDKLQMAINTQLILSTSQWITLLHGVTWQFLFFCLLHPSHKSWSFIQCTVKIDTWPYTCMSPSQYLHVQVNDQSILCAF